MATKTIISVVLSLFILAACNKKEVPKEVKKETTPAPQASKADMQQVFTKSDN